jgi:lipooligosaccharide transport system ATP-binding protein
MRSSRPSPAIELRAVCKSFGNGPVVEEVSFSVERGTCFGLIGPNGAGKTTILKMIYGFVRPSAGTVTVGGVDVLREPGKAREGLGIAPQEDILDPDLTVAQNLLFHARYCSLPRGEARERTQRLLREMGLEVHADEAVAHLSTGLRRRLVLARALLNDPGIVILDEPTRGIDRRSRGKYLEALQGMKERGVTLMLATHEHREAEALCDQVAVVERGRILAEGPAAEILPPRDGGHVNPRRGREAAC